jgi:hypothetical protein
MRLFLIFSFLVLAITSFGQINDTWYTIRVNDLNSISISAKQLIKGTIWNYNTPKQGKDLSDTFTIKKKLIKDDSTFYIVTNKESDYFGKTQKEFMVHKFQYHKLTNTLSTYSFFLLKNYIELVETKKKYEFKDIVRLIENDSSNDFLLTCYKMDTVKAFLKYPKLIDQPKSTLLELYSNLTKAYERIKGLNKEQQFGYGFLMSSTVEVPEYLKLKICPLIKPENFDEIDIREKYKDDKEVLIALGKLRRARNFQQ